MLHTNLMTVLDSWGNPLTFSAVLALPARVAYDLSSLAAGEMSKSIISGPAKDWAAVAVVVLITEEAVGVAQLCLSSCLHVLGPFFSHIEVALSGDPANQTLRVVCTIKSHTHIYIFCLFYVSFLIIVCIMTKRQLNVTAMSCHFVF